MTTPARIVVLPAGGSELEIQSVQIPDPGLYEIVIEMGATGVCHSQLDHIAGADPSKPLLLGHEAAGTVLHVGDSVSHVEPGDEVLVTWLPRNSDRTPQPVSIPLANGDVAVTRNVFTWGTHCLADEQYVVKAPTGLPADLVSIVGCAVMTGAGAVLNAAEVQPGSSVAVWGAGGVGLSAIAAARNCGASSVIAVDIDESKLQLAKRLGADHVVNATQVDAVEEIRRIAAHPDGTAGVDHAVDCTGLAGNLAKTVAAVRPGLPGQRQGGTAVLLGAIRTAFELGGMELINGQKRLIGCLGGACIPDRDFPILLGWFSNDQLDLAALVTDRYDFDDVSTAVDDLRAGRIGGRAILEF